MVQFSIHKNRKKKKNIQPAITTAKLNFSNSQQINIQSVDS